MVKQTEQQPQPTRTELVEKMVAAAEGARRRTGDPVMVEWRSALFGESVTVKIGRGAAEPQVIHQFEEVADGDDEIDAGYPGEPEADGCDDIDAEDLR